MKRGIIFGYAYLKASFDTNKTSPVDLMLPLVSRALMEVDGALISAPPLQEAVRNLWGLSIPENVIRFMLPKLEDSGDLKYEHHAYFKTDRLDKRVSSGAEKKAEEVYARVRLGIQRLLLVHNLALDLKPDEVIERFLDTGGSAFLTNSSSIPYVDPNDIRVNILMAEYMGLDQGAKNSREFEDVLSLAIGDALYKAITSLSESDLDTATNKRMAGVRIFFDTSIVLRLLRYEQQDLQKPALEMLRLAQATGCDIFVFQHTFDEVQGILRATAETAYSKGKKSGLVLRIEVLGISKSDLYEDAALLLQTLSSLGLEVVAAPEIAERLAVHERDLDTHLQSKVGYKRQEAKVRDIASLTAIYRLREGDIRDHLESCDAIFITTNVKLAAVSTDFFRKLFREESRTNIVQHCMTDVIFTMRMWLKSPSEFSTVPRSRLIAHSLSTLKPHDELYETFLHYLARLVEKGSLTTDQAVQARLSALVTPTLMIQTEGRVDALTEGTTARIVANILARQEEARVAAIESVVAIERKRSKEALDAVQNELAEAVEQHETRLKEERARTQDVQCQIDRLRQNQERTEDALEKLSTRVASWGEKTVVWLSYLVICLLVFFVMLDALANWPLPEKLERSIGATLVHFVETTLSLVLAVLAFVGMSYRDVAKRFRERLHRNLLIMARRALGLRFEKTDENA